MKESDKAIWQKNSVVPIVLYGVLALIVFFSLKVDNPHPHSWLEAHLPFFWSIFAFISAMVIIGLSKWLARAGLEGTERSYDQPLMPEPLTPTEEEQS